MFLVDAYYLKYCLICDTCNIENDRRKVRWVCPAESYLGELCLGKARLAHLGRLTHRDVALGQWPLREGLGGPILTGLAASSQALSAALVS